MDRATGVRNNAEPRNLDAPGKDWRRNRQSFSCTDAVWDRAKATWKTQRRQYPAWTEWLEAALDEKAESVHAALGVTAASPLPPAPDRLPPGRRTPSDSLVGRSRRAFTCAPAIWTAARAAWWTEEDSYPAWTDWIEEAIREKVDRRAGRMSETYDVTVTRDGRFWMVAVDALDALTQTRRLAEVEQMARELIALETRTSVDAVRVAVRVQLANTDLTARAQEVKTARAEAEASEARALSVARNLARDLTAADVPVRDIATLLDVSHQRVSQLVNS